MKTPILEALFVAVLGSLQDPGNSYSGIFKARLFGAEVLDTKAASNGFALNSFAIWGRHTNSYSFQIYSEFISLSA
jgi:hypothetical protein